MKITRSVSFGMGAVLALVLGSGTAYAATGGKFILGHSNTARTTTTLVNPKGTPLLLKAKAGKAPLAVNSATKVANLNSDRLDGYDSSQFALAAGNVKAYDFDGELADLSGDGTAETIIASAACPAGTRRTGGGGADFTSSGYTVINAPDEHNAWTVIVAIDPSAGEDPSDVVGSIVCYNPRGVPAGGYRQAPAKLIKVKPSAALLAKVAHRIR
jgi:hypothetical protein